jgi:hypothetical protein
MPDLGAAVTDPELLRQLEGQSPPKLGSAVDATTATLLDQLPSDAGQAPVQTGSPSLMTNFLYGMRQPIDQGAMMLAKAIFPSQVPNVAAANQTAQRAFEEQKMPGTAGDVAQFAGNIVPGVALSAALPGAGAASLLPRVASGAASGAISGALQPVDPNATDFWSQVQNNALFSAGAGAVMPPLLSGLSRVINPAAVARNAELMQRDVRPTIGQTLGGATGRIEEALSSWPLVGDIIRSGRSRAVDQFNRAAINDVLAPIGEKLETDEIGRPALIEMSDKVNKAFRNAVPQAGGVLDPQAISEISNLRQMARFTPRAQEFDDLLRSEVFSQLSPNGGMTGQAFKNMDSTLGRIVRDNVYGHGVPWQDRQFGGAARELQSTLRSWVARVNPSASKDLSNANLASARQLRVEHASTMRGTGEEPGKFSAAQLLSGVEKYANSKTQLMRGGALTQPLAEAGKNVLGAKVPDSGTPFRSIMALLGGTLGPAVLGHGLAPAAAESLAGAGALGLGAAGLYSSPGQSLAAHILAARPELAKPLAATVRGAGSYAAAAAPWLAPFGFGSGLATAP